MKHAQITIKLFLAFFLLIAGTGIREQFNILTAFLDASQVYGSEPERAEQLRAFNGGMWKKFMFRWLWIIDISDFAWYSC